MGIDLYVFGMVRDGYFAGHHNRQRGKWHWVVTRESYVLHLWISHQRLACGPLEHEWVRQHKGDRSFLLRLYNEW